MFDEKKIRVNAKDLPFWAKITGSVLDPITSRTLYSWVEMQPGYSLGPEVVCTFITMESGRTSGTLVSLKELAFEPNGNPLATDTIVSMVRGYWDPDSATTAHLAYEWVYVIMSVPNPNPAITCAEVEFIEQEVRCEDGLLNIYEKTDTLNIESGCLVKVEGSWTLARNEGKCGVDVVQVINYVDVFTEFTTYVENVWYFNQYDDNTYININNVWYVYCYCGQGSGSGSGSGSGNSLIDTACCPSGTLEKLTLTIVSGCPGASTSQPLSHNGTLWTTDPETFSGNTVYWTMECSGTDLLFTHYCNGVASGISYVASGTYSCHPFDTGNVALPASAGCCDASVVLRATE